MWVKYNPNPCGNKVGDCVVRALCKALDQDWETTYTDLCFQGLKACDMPSSNSVWGNYLISKGFKLKAVDIQSVEELCKSLPKGTYLLCTGSHVVCMIDGSFYDLWDSSREQISFMYVKEK